VLAMVSTSPSTFKSVVTSDFSKASILVRTKLSGSRRIEETLDRIRTYIAEHFPAEIPVRLTGTLVLLTGTTSDIVAGQIKSLTLALGIIFLVMTAMFLSANIGFFAILTMVTALGANLILLPALLATTKIITLWDLLGVRLGDDPARTIPLFAGLRRAEARIVVLMGEMKRFQPGDIIIRRGE